VAIRPSAGIEHFSLHTADFGKILYLSLLSKSVGKFKVILKSDTNIRQSG
jgi:hypothetical protein